MSIRPAIIARIVALSLLAGGFTACASGGGGAVLNWYINPDNGGQGRLAASCSAASGGKYRIVTSLLPNDATSQREQLVRRLAAKDGSISLMSLDPPFIAEAANAGFLRPFSESEATQFTSGVLNAAVANAQWDGKLFAAPFWANTQLLWYRKSVVQKAGVDPTAPDFTWDRMIDAAVRGGATVAEQGNKYEGYMVWINALVASAGGQIISDANKGANATVSINSPAGRQAATIIGKLARSSAASPTLSTDTEEQGRPLSNSARPCSSVSVERVGLAADERASFPMIAAACLPAGLLMLTVAFAPLLASLMIWPPADATSALDRKSVV